MSNFLFREEISANFSDAPEKAAAIFFDGIYQKAIDGELPDSVFQDKISVQILTFARGDKATTLAIGNYMTAKKDGGCKPPLGLQDDFNEAVVSFEQCGLDMGQYDFWADRSDTLAVHFAGCGEYEKAFDVLNRGGVPDPDMLLKPIKDNDLETVQKFCENYKVDPNQPSQNGARRLTNVQSKDMFLYLVRQGADPTYLTPFGDDAAHYYNIQDYDWGCEDETLPEAGLKKFAQGFITGFYEAHDRELPVFADGDAFAYTLPEGTEADFEEGRQKGAEYVGAGYVKEPLFGEREQAKDPIGVMLEEMLQGGQNLLRREQELLLRGERLKERAAAYQRSGVVDIGELLAINEECIVIGAECEALVRDTVALRADHIVAAKQAGLDAQLGLD